MNQNLRFDSDQRCMKKAGGCVPGGAQKGGDAKDGKCATDMMNDKCKKGLNDKCGSSGLANVTVAPTAALPANCDFVAQGVDKADSTFILTCFGWIAKTFFRRSMTFNPQEITNDANIVNAALAPATLRYLQQDSTVSVIPVAQDVSATNTVFQDQTLAAIDVVVDGSTPTTTATTTNALAEITTAATSAAFLKFSAFLIFVFGLLL